MRNVFSMLVLVSGLFVALPVMAEENDVNIAHQVQAHQFLSKRPYANHEVLAKSEAEQAWVGASMVVGQDKPAQQLYLLKMHQTAKRAF